MSKIDEMLKNEKVEWKKLSEVFYTRTGYTPSKKIKKFWNNGTVNWFTIEDIRNRGGLLSFANQKITSDAVKKEPFKKNSLVLSTIATIGEYALIDVDFVINQQFMVFTKKEGYEDLVNMKFMYYYFSKISEFCIRNKRVGNVPTVDNDIILNYYLPIPSLKIQEKIAKTLDKFTNYVTELQSELQSRNRQYEYYRDKLLSEEYLNKAIINYYKSDNTRYLSYEKISDICLRQRGIKITAKEMNELNNDFSSVKVFAGGNTSAMLNKDEVGEENVINKPSVIVKSRGNIDFEYYDKEFTHKNEMWSYSSLDESKLNIKYLYYILKNNLKYFRDNAISGKLPQIATGVTDNYKIPLPNIYIQDQVVEILDKFQELTQNVSGLLPDEIEKRQKQYEYYREKLLTFDTERTRGGYQVLSKDYISLLTQAGNLVGIKVFEIENVLLKNISAYSSNKIDIKELNEENYVGVDNLLKDKLGKVNSNNLPKSGNVNFFKKGDILLGNIRPYLRKIWLADINGGASPDVLVISLKENEREKVLAKYLYYLLSSEEFFDYDIKFSRGAKMPRGNKSKIMDYKILIPPLPIQEYIVSMLDEFEALSQSTTEGLRREIELREKQYEYYREKLLTFEK